MSVKLYISKIPEELDISFLSQLSEYRKNKLSKASNDKLIRQSIAGELLLEKALEGLYSRPLPLELSDNAKPYIIGSKLHFNLSHSGEYVACAVCSEELGLDIQLERNCDLKLAKRYFTDEEYKYLVNNPHAFTEIWVKKESRLKALGTGLKAGLDSFSVFDKAWEYHYCRIGDLHIAVCVPNLESYKVDIIEIKLL